MTDVRTMARLGLSGVAVAETAATWTRWEQRRRLFQAADERARQLGRPLLVVLPRKEGWFNRSMRLYEYGARYPDIFSRRNSPVIFADTLARGVAVQGDSAVLYVACVLEYVTDLRRSMDEIMRIAGEPENIYIVTVQPWTLTAALHPAARWAGIADTHAVSMGPGDEHAQGRRRRGPARPGGPVLSIKKRPMPRAPAPEPDPRNPRPRGSRSHEKHHHRTRRGHRGRGRRPEPAGPHAAPGHGRLACPTPNLSAARARLPRARAHHRRRRPGAADAARARPARHRRQRGAARALHQPQGARAPGVRPRARPQRHGPNAGHSYFKARFTAAGSWPRSRPWRRRSSAWPTPSPASAP
jgi:hypothetical protein